MNTKSGMFYKYKNDLGYKLKSLGFDIRAKNQNQLLTLVKAKLDALYDEIKDDVLSTPKSQLRDVVLTVDDTIEVYVDFCKSINIPELYLEKTAAGLLFLIIHDFELDGDDLKLAKMKLYYDITSNPEFTEFKSNVATQIFITKDEMAKILNEDSNRFKKLL